MSKWLSSSISSAFSSFSTSVNGLQQHEEEEELDDEAISIKPPTRERLAIRANNSRNGSNSSNQSQQHSFSLQNESSPSVSIHGVEEGQLPATPPSQTAPSPRTRANDSGSLVLSSILESHPQFSVFRKSTSFPSDLDDVDSPTPLNATATAGSPHRMTVNGSYSNHATPSKTPGPATRRRIERDFPESPTFEDAEEEDGDGSMREQSEEWHLSSVEELASLDFGDTSSQQQTPPPATPHPNQSSINLIDTSSPPTRLPSSQHLSPSPPQLSQSQSVPRTPSSAPPSTKTVQFSPLGLAPSPLLNRPPLPEPTPSSLNHNEWGGFGFNDSPSTGILSSNGKGILKAPRTPGTGRSVRFSASTGGISTLKENVSPDELERFADPNADVGADEDEEDEEEEEDSATSHRHASTFLQQLQAVIPSPENSFDQPLSAVENRRLSGGSAGNVSIPKITVESDTVDPSISNLFDVSAPDYDREDSHSISLEREDSFVEIDLEGQIGTPLRKERSVELEVKSGETERTAYTANSSNGTYGTPRDYQSPASSPSPSPNHHSTAVDATPIATSSSPPLSPPLPPLTQSDAHSFSFNLSTVSSEAQSFSSPRTHRTASPSPSRHKTPSPSPPKVRRHSSFYREFLKKRAPSSTVAADELGRLVVEEGSTPSPTPSTSPGRKRRLEDAEEGRQTPLRVSGGDISAAYYSPEKSRSEGGSIIEKGEYDDEEEEDDFDAEKAFGSFASTTITSTPVSAPPVTSNGLLATPLESFVPIAESLSPIYEESEPNTTVELSIRSPDSILGNRSNRSLNNSGRRKSSISIIRHSKEEESISALSTALVTQPSPPRRGHQRSQSALVVPSPHPFGNSSDLNLVHSLLSAQGDMLANNSSQKFLLSSLISNMREDSDRKDLMIENLQKQKEQIENDWRSSIEQVELWEQRNTERDLSKVVELEELVAKLTIELEDRTALERSEAKRVEDEARLLKGQLADSRSDLRDSEIRLRHARASQAEAEALRFAAERERDELRELVGVEQDQVELLRRERDDLNARLRRERAESDQVINTLKEDMDRLSSTEPGIASEEMDAKNSIVHAEVSREIALIKSELESQTSSLASQLELVAELRNQNHALREEAATSAEEARKEYQSLELELLDARTEVDRLREELSDLEDDRQLISNKVDEVSSRLESVEEDRERELEHVRTELDSYKTMYQDTHVAHDELLKAINQMERATTEKVATLEATRKEYESFRMESNALLDDRDRRIADIQKALASKTAKYDVLEKECTRLKELVSVLRRESADREVKVARLQKTKTEMQEDIDGLNIALEAKQVEVSMYKRQMAASRIPTRPRSSLSNTSANSSSLSSIASDQLLPSVQKSRPGIATPAARSKASPIFDDRHNETPSKVAQPIKKPSLGFGTSSRRPSNEPVVLGPPKAPRSAAKSSKENVSPRKRSDSSGSVARRKSSMILA